MPPLPPVAPQDLEHILERSYSDWQNLRGERLFITGGTGFFGTWLLEAIVAANQQLNTGIETWILSRDPSAFARRSPHLAEAPGIHWLKGSVADFAFPNGTFSHVIHAATAASAQLNENRPREMLDTIVCGTERVLEFAVSHATSKMLLTSSGAIYGPQPVTLQGFPENYNAPPDCLSPRSAYAEGKRTAELLCAQAAEHGRLTATIARCFAFVGPHLPIDSHFAVGNFIADHLARRTITIKGDGTAQRSYLYAADLVIWLLAILNRGKNRTPYNVGSDVALSIAELAHRVAGLDRSGEVTIQTQATPGLTPERYCPNIEKARKELNLEVRINLDEALRRTVLWHNQPHFAQQ